jgi:hypothetical protein
MVDFGKYNSISTRKKTKSSFSQFKSLQKMKSKLLVCYRHGLFTIILVNRMFLESRNTRWYYESVYYKA